jgi:hypothetical protein
MKLLGKLGDALLTKLVPGIDARAGCGRCRRGNIVCNRCPQPNVGLEYWYDDCGNVCGAFCNERYFCT